MSSRGVRKARKVILTIFVILSILILGVFFGAYYLIKDAENRGIQFDGEWFYNGDVVLDVDHDEETYTFNVDDINENGNIKEIELLKEDMDNLTLVYKVTLNGNGTHNVDVKIKIGDGFNEMEFKSDQYDKTYTFTQPVEEDK